MRHMIENRSNKRKGSNMSNNDLPVVLYKLLAYIYECMKNDVIPTVEQAKKLCAANETMFDAAVCEAIEGGYVRGIDREFYYTGPEINFDNARLTLDGSTFLLENSTMSKAKELAGEAFQTILSQVIAVAARAIGL